MMKRYHVEVYYQVSGHMYVDAENEDDAREKVSNIEGLPDNLKYTDITLDITNVEFFSLAIK